jgi:hypothetical protein
VPENYRGSLSQIWGSLRKEVSDKIWLISFMQYDLGYFGHDTCRLESIDNPFPAKSVTHVSGISC